MLDEFATTQYTFQKMASGIVETEYSGRLGVFKERTGLDSSQGRHDSYTVTSTLHIYSYEDFIAVVGGYLGLIDHHVLVNGNTYRVSGVTNGASLTEDGASEFYRLVLTKVDSPSTSDLPLE